MPDCVESPAIAHAATGKLQYWKRQFLDEPSKYQVHFDWLFGVVMPIACFIFDHVVFRDYATPDGGLLVHFGFFAYAEAALSIAALAVWRLVRPRSGLIAGVLLAGSMVAFALGFLLLPLSIVCSICLIGLLGLTPLVTGFVLLRNAVRACRWARCRHGRTFQSLLVAIGFMLTLAIPAAGQYYFNTREDQAIQAILAGQEPEQARAIAYFKRYSWTTGLIEFIEAFEQTDDEAAKDRIADAYHAITGRGFEQAMVD